MIKRTETTEISSPVKDVNKEVDPLEACCRRVVGLIALTCFFNTVSNRHLASSVKVTCQQRYTRGYWPTPGTVCTIHVQTSLGSFTPSTKRIILFGMDQMNIKFSAERQVKQQQWKFLPTSYLNTRRIMKSSSKISKPVVYQ